MQLPQKKSTFSLFFCRYLNCTLNVDHFQRKGDSHCSDISEIKDSEKHSSIIVSKVPSERPLREAPSQMGPRTVDM